MQDAAFLDTSTALQRTTNLRRYSPGCTALEGRKREKKDVNQKKSTLYRPYAQRSYAKPLGTYLKVAAATLSCSRVIASIASIFYVFAAVSIFAKPLIPALLVPGQLHLGFDGNTGTFHVPFPFL